MCRSGQIYDKTAADYDRLIAPLENWFLRELRQKAVSHLPGDAHRILEIGAGTGLNFSYYRSAASISATDISHGMLSVATNKIQGSKITLTQADAEQLPFQDAAFDAAFCSLVFCSIACPEKALGEIRRVVRKGGKVILLEHVRPDGVLGPVFDLLNTLTVRFMDDHFNRRTADVAASAGLTVLSVEKKLRGIINLITCIN